MTKFGAAFWLSLVLVSGFTTFKVKYAVQDIDDQLAHARKQEVVEQQEIRVLNAEWTYLNQPERLADMNKRLLQYTPVTAKQLQQKIEDIPLRPPPIPEPDTVVAAAPTPAAALPAPAPTATPTVLAQAPAPPAPAALPAPMPVRPPVRIATADATNTPASLDALFAQIAEKR